jgi:hypothetical protein
MFHLNKLTQASNVALERLAHATLDKSHSPASPLQALVRRRLHLASHPRSVRITLRPSGSTSLAHLP